MFALTADEKAYIFELLDFVRDVKDDVDDSVWTNEDILDRIADVEDKELINQIVNKLHNLGWSKHRKHDV